MRIRDLLRTLFGKERNPSLEASEYPGQVNGTTGRGLSHGSTPTPSCWCLVGNIVIESRHGDGGSVIDRGTKHFSPGTKVYCLPAQWGDGYEKIVVIGRHRGSKRFVRMVVRADWVTNWRAKTVYEPAVVRLIEEGTREPWKRGFASKEVVENYVAELKARECKETGGTIKTSESEFGKLRGLGSG
jgi:hypothetical protein